MVQVSQTHAVRRLRGRDRAARGEGDGEAARGRTRRDREARLRPQDTALSRYGVPLDAQPFLWEPIMKKAGLTILCVLSVQGVLACGTSESDPIFPSGHAGTKGTAGSSSGSAGDAGSNGVGGSGGSNANAGKGGKGGTGGSAGGSATTGGTGGGGAGGDQSSGGTGDNSSGGDGTSGDAGASAGGSSGSGGNAGTGDAGDGGTAGQPTIDCNSVHPNVNGSERTCNPDRCYCSGNDGCFEVAVASSCCKETVVCDAGAMNPVVTINHPGNGETRFVADGEFPFVGVATDPQDGALTGASLVWTSSELSAPFGTGETFDAVLPTGTHVITLTATDSDSNTGTDTITVTME
jgi:hypothetical protein